HILPPIAGHIFSLDAVRRYAFPTISQIGITYRHSSLSNHAGDQDFEIKAGDRMPYFLIDGKNVFDRLNESKFHFLTFSAQPANFQFLPVSAPTANLNSLKEEIEGQYAPLMDFNAIPMSHEVKEIFRTEKDFSVLLRPDNHVSSISSDVSSNRAKEYFTKFIGHTFG